MLLQKLTIKGAGGSDREVCGGSSSLYGNVRVTFIS